MQLDPELLERAASGTLDLEGGRSPPDAVLGSELVPGVFIIEAARRSGMVQTLRRRLGLSQPFRADELTTAVSNLTRYGFSGGSATGGVVLILAALISADHHSRKNREGDDGDRVSPFTGAKSVEALALGVFDSLLCGTHAPLAADSASWFLNVAAKAGFEEGRRVRDAFDAAVRGDVEARRQIVIRGHRLWQQLVLPTLSAESSFHQESLGVLHEFMNALREDPVVRLRLGLLLRRFGHAGEEREAARMIASAALDGSKGAWQVIEEIVDRGDSSDLIDALIQVGKERAQIEDNDFGEIDL